MDISIPSFIAINRAFLVLLFSVCLVIWLFCLFVVPVVFCLVVVLGLGVFQFSWLVRFSSVCCLFVFVLFFGGASSQ